MSLDWSLINSETLNSLDLDLLIEGVEQPECFAYGEELSRVERDEARWGPAQLECSRFVEQVLGMMLKRDRPEEPYGPMFVFGDRRSAIPANFPKTELLGLQALGADGVFELSNGRSGPCVTSLRRLVPSGSRIVGQRMADSMSSSIDGAVA